MSPEQSSGTMIPLSAITTRLGEQQLEILSLQAQIAQRDELLARASAELAKPAKKARPKRQPKPAQGPTRPQLVRLPDTQATPPDEEGPPAA